jgi:predicted NBD/HSP70 family sugar kinase
MSNPRPADRAKNITIAIAIVVTILCGLAVCVFGAVFFLLPSEPNTTEEYVQEYGGNADVYDRILLNNDCSALQAEFEIAFENSQMREPGTSQHKWSTGYMAAVNNRMEEIGCYSEK